MKLQLPPGTFSAYLFDCDGTVVDSMPLHYIAWKKVLSEWGGTFDEELFYSWGGVPPLEIATRINRMQTLNMPVEAVAEHKENSYFSLLPELKVVPEVLEHINAQQGRIPFAVVSGSTRESIVKSLTTVGLLDRFAVLVGSEDYPRSSPRPMHIWLPPRASASRQRNALSLKTQRSAFRALPLLAWRLFVFPYPTNAATEPCAARLRSHQGKPRGGLFVFHPPR